MNATAGSSSLINLAWSDNASNETGFGIERSPDGTSFTEIATAGDKRHDLLRHRLERVHPVLVSRARLQRRRDHPNYSNSGERDDPGATTAATTICADGIDSDAPIGTVHARVDR